MWKAGMTLRALIWRIAPSARRVKRCAASWSYVLGEPKASQLLSEVERVELSQQRARDQKEGMYRAAMEAERRGDISSALSKLERVLEIEKEAPEPARTGTYQRLYDKVRSEYESIKGARAEAKRLLDDGKFCPSLGSV